MFTNWYCNKCETQNDICALYQSVLLDRTHTGSYMSGDSKHIDNNSSINLQHQNHNITNIIKYVFKTKTKKQTKKNIHVYIHNINFIKCSVISTLFIILFNKDNYFVTTCRTTIVIRHFCI
jgi:hypothetical protein